MILNAQIAADTRWPAAPLWLAAAVLTDGAQLLPHPMLGRILGLAVATATVTVATGLIRGTPTRPA